MIVEILIDLLPHLMSTNIHADCNIYFLSNDPLLFSEKVLVTLLLSLHPLPHLYHSSLLFQDINLLLCYVIQVFPSCSNHSHVIQLLKPDHDSKPLWHNNAINREVCVKVKLSSDRDTPSIAALFISHYRALPRAVIMIKQFSRKTLIILPDANCDADDYQAMTQHLLSNKINL